MLKVKYSVSTLLLSGMLALFAACSGTHVDSSQPAPQPPSESLSSSAVESSTAPEDSPFPFDLVTDNDAVVTFTQVPERVMAANPNAGEQLMALGLGDKIIATSYNNAPIAEQFRAEYESKSSLTLTEQPSLEVVLELNPDFIYGRSSAFGKNGITDHDTLAQNGIMSLASIEGYKIGADVEDVYQDYRNLGRLFQVEDRAEQLVAETQARIDAVAQKLEGVEPIKVFNFDMEMDGGAYTPGNNFASNLFARAGGINVFKDLEKNWNTVSWEAVVDANPDVIVINDYDEEALDAKIALLKNNPALSGVKAIQENRFVVVKLPEVFAGARVADTIEKLAQGFHPDVFA